jgi:hypothetical protein
LGGKSSARLRQMITQSLAVVNTNVHEAVLASFVVSSASHAMNYLFHDSTVHCHARAVNRLPLSILRCLQPQTSLVVYPALGSTAHTCAWQHPLLCYDINEDTSQSLIDRAKGKKTLDRTYIVRNPQTSRHPTSSFQIGSSSSPSSSSSSGFTGFSGAAESTPFSCLGSSALTSSALISLTSLTFLGGRSVRLSSSDTMIRPRTAFCNRCILGEDAGFTRVKRVAERIRCFPMGKADEGAADSAKDQVVFCQHQMHTSIM